MPSADDPHSTLVSGQVSLDFTCHPAQKRTAESAPIKIKVGVKNTKNPPCFLARTLTPNYMMILFHTTVEEYSALCARVAFLYLLSLEVEHNSFSKNDTAQLLPVHEPGGEGVAAQEDRRL